MSRFDVDPDDRPTRAEAMEDGFDRPENCDGWHRHPYRAWGELLGRCYRCGLTPEQVEAFEEGR